MSRRAQGLAGRAARLSILPLVLSCAASDSDAAGRLEAAWTGADSGAVRSPATARWCPEGRFAEVVGASGDTGVAVALRQIDSLAPGRFSAVLPDSADTLAPSATVALRFLSRTTITGYRSDSGAVTVTRGADGLLGVAFAVRARVPEAAARISLHGRAGGLHVRKGGEECATTERGVE